MKLSVHSKKRDWLTRNKSIVSNFKPVWLIYTGYISLFISDYDNTFMNLYETRKNRNQTGLKKFKLTTNQAMTIILYPSKELLTWVFLSGRETSTSRVLASSVLPFLSTLGLSFIVNLSLLSLSQRMFLYIVQLNSLGELNSFCLISIQNKTTLVSDIQNLPQGS